MKKRLQEWVKERKHIKISIICNESNSPRIACYSGFLLDFDDLGIEISKSHTQDMPVLFPWSNIVNIEPWGKNKL